MRWTISVEFSVYKSPYNNCGQMGFIPLTIHQNRCRLGNIQPSSSSPSWFQGAASRRSRQEGNVGEEREGLGGGGEGKGMERGMGKEGKRDKLGEWRHGRWGDRRPWSIMVPNCSRCFSGLAFRAACFVPNLLV